MAENVAMGLIFALRDSREHRSCSIGAQMVLEYLVDRAGLKKDGTWSCKVSNARIARDLGKRDREGNLVGETKDIIRNNRRLCRELEGAELVLREPQTKQSGADTVNKYTIAAPRIFAAAKKNRADEKRLWDEKQANKEARMKAFLGEVEDAVDEDRDDDDPEQQAKDRAELDAMLDAPNKTKDALTGKEATEDGDTPDADPNEMLDTEASSKPDEDGHTPLSVAALIYAHLGINKAKRSVLYAAEIQIEAALTADKSLSQELLPTFLWAMECDYWKDAMEKITKTTTKYKRCPVAFLLAKYKVIRGQRDKSEKPTTATHTAPKQTTKAEATKKAYATPPIPEPPDDEYPEEEELEEEPDEEPEDDDPEDDYEDEPEDDHYQDPYDEFRSRRREEIGRM